MAVRPGRTPGRPNSAVGVKWYYKPALGKMVGRIPGVVRASARVLAINEYVQRKLSNTETTIRHPASLCKAELEKKGKKGWRYFIACLSRRMRDALEAGAPEIAKLVEDIKKTYKDAVYITPGEGKVTGRFE